MKTYVYLVSYHFQCQGNSGFGNHIKEYSSKIDSALKIRNIENIVEKDNKLISVAIINVQLLKTNKEK